jgi:hypothetical protein
LFFPDFQQRLFKKTSPCAMIDEEKENNLQWSDVERIIGTMLREYIRVRTGLFPFFFFNCAPNKKWLNTSSSQSMRANEVVFLLRR